MNRVFILTVLCLLLGGEGLAARESYFDVTVTKPINSNWQASIKALSKVKSIAKVTISATSAGIFWHKQNLNHTYVFQNQNIGQIKVSGQKQRLAILREKLRLDKKLLKRTAGLYKTGLTTLSQLQIAQNAVADDTMRLQVLKSALYFNLLNAPVSGTLNYLVPTNTKVAQNTPLATIKGSSSAWLSVFVTPNITGEIHVKEQTRWQVGSYTGVGVIQHISNNALDTGLVQIIIKPFNASKLLAGEWVHVIIPTKHSKGIRVPLKSVVTYNTKTIVYKVVKHHAIPLDVKVLYANSKYAWVAANLKSTDNIIVQGASSVIPKTPVHIIKATAL